MNWPPIEDLEGGNREGKPDREKSKQAIKEILELAGNRNPELLRVAGAIHGFGVCSVADMEKFLDTIEGWSRIHATQIQYPPNSQHFLDWLSREGLDTVIPLAVAHPAILTAAAPLNPEGTWNRAWTAALSPQESKTAQKGNPTRKGKRRAKKPFSTEDRQQWLSRQIEENQKETRAAKQDHGRTTQVVEQGDTAPEEKPQIDRIEPPEWFRKMAAIARGENIPDHEIPVRLEQAMNQARGGTSKSEWFERELIPAMCLSSLDDARSIVRHWREDPEMTLLYPSLRPGMPHTQAFWTHLRCQANWDLRNFMLDEALPAMIYHRHWTDTEKIKLFHDLVQGVHKNPRTNPETHRRINLWKRLGGNTELPADPENKEGAGDGFSASAHRTTIAEWIAQNVDPEPSQATRQTPKAH